MQTDFLVIGSGIAGLSFALKAARLGHVVIVTKRYALDSNTWYAQGGIACVSGAYDDPESHIEDTISAGSGINNRAAVEKIVYCAPECIRELIDLGVEFSKDDAGHLDLGQEGGHSCKRIVHAKDYTGKEIAETLYKAVRHHPSITLLEFHCATDLLIKGKKADSSCRGAWILDVRANRLRKIEASFTVLCTGGAGQVYKHTTNPDVATGDGIAMAWRAGAKVSDLEFMQFHPTAVYSPQGESFLISEALRGFGAELELIDGTRFMDKYHKMGSLAPRDVVSRAIIHELRQTGEPCVYLNTLHLPAEKLKSEFPQIYGRCKSMGIDICSQRIPVVPSAHYMCGGVVTDLNGETTVARLYAFGETACTGVHGANRLASNSLLEAMVFSAAAFNHIRKNFQTPCEDGEDIFDSTQIPAGLRPGEVLKCEKIIQSVQEIMWKYAGILRHTDSLKNASWIINSLADKAEEIFQELPVSGITLETRNIATTAKLIIEAALARRKSCGLHQLEVTEGQVSLA